MEAMLSLIVFVMLMVGTPGPANLLLLTVGARLGVLQAMPFIGGLIIGKALLNLTMGLGIGALLPTVPWLMVALQVLSVAFICWLALSAWQAVPQVPADNLGTAQDAAQPRQTQALSAGYSLFVRGMIVHPLNPKAWAMITLAWSKFAPTLGSLGQQLWILLLVFAGVQLLLHTLWAGLGSWLSRVMQHAVLLNRVLVILTIVVTLGIVLIPFVD